MKKIAVLLMLTIASIAVHAQFYAGGTLGIGVVNAGYEDEWDGEYESETNVSFVLSPEVGYNFNSIWAVGGTIDLRYQNPADAFTLSVLPYVRGTFAHVSVFDFFGEGALGYICQFSGGEGLSGFSIALRPGFVAHITDKFGIVGKTTLFEYDYINGVNGMGFAINSGFQIGVQFTL